MMPSSYIGGLSPSKRALLEQRLASPAGGAPHITGPVARRDRQGPAQLSPLQDDLWHFSRVEPDSLASNEAATIRMQGPFDPDALRFALLEVVRRHEILRSTFELIDGEPMQVVHPAATLQLPVVDVGAMASDEREAEAARLASVRATRPYDLARPPLIRPLLVRFALDHHRLYLALHQMVFDCMSLYRVIVPELVALYEDAGATLPQPPLQYADHAAWMREWVRGGEVRDRIEYWRQRLDGASTVHLPLDRPRPARGRFLGAVHRAEISRARADQLRALGRERDATLFQVLAAAFAVFLRGQSGQEEIVFGTLSDFRDHPQLDALVGYCATPMAIGADMREDPAFGELVGHMRRELLMGLGHLTPFGQLVRELRPRHQPGAHPIFQAALVFQPSTSAIGPAWSIHQVEPEAGDSVKNLKYDLQLELDERADGSFNSRLIYDTDLFEPRTAASMVRHWTMLLQRIAATPAARISDLVSSGRHLESQRWGA